MSENRRDQNEEVYDLAGFSPTLPPSEVHHEKFRPTLPAIEVPRGDIRLLGWDPETNGDCPFGEVLKCMDRQNREVYLKADADLGRTYDLAISAKELHDLRTAEAGIIKQIKRPDNSPKDAIAEEARRGAVRDYLKTSENQRRIKARLVQLKIAEPLTYGDWKVNRTVSVPEGLGIKSLEQAETVELQFLREHGLLAVPNPIYEAKLVSLHLGCGNGILLDSLQRSSISPLSETGRSLSSYFAEIGLADKMYYTPNDMLSGLVMDKYHDLPEVQELIDLICKLIIRKIYYAKKYNTRVSGKNEDLLNLIHDPNGIRQVLCRLPEYLDLKKFLGGNQLKDDGEFPEEEPREISAKCRALIQEIYFGESDREDTPETKLRKYLKPEFFDSDLATQIQLWSHRVILGRFENLAEIFPEKPLFAIAHSFRSTSHLENQPYKNLIGDVARRLIPGGIIIDDGIRESYTRDHRYDELAGLLKQLAKMQSELGNHFKIEVIADAEGPKSILVQRGIVKTDGSVAFFEDSHKEDLLRKGCSCVPITEFTARWPEMHIKNQILLRLKQLFIEQTMVSDDPEETRREKTRDGRMRFKKIHGELDRTLHSLWESNEWKEAKKDTAGEMLLQFESDAFDKVRSEIDSVRNQVGAVLNGAIPVIKRRTKRNCVRKTKTEDTTPLLRQRTPLIALPRNTEIPGLHELYGERTSMLARLRQFKTLTDRKPITILEFDRCFTNRLARQLFTQILGDEETARELVHIQPIHLDQRDYPTPEENQIYFFGGSMSSVYDCNGENFTKGFSLPLLRMIQDGANIRAFGTCFGHQTLLTAYGKTKYRKQNFETKPGALEFGVVRVKFEGVSDPAIKHLRAREVSVPMTRSDYTLVPGYGFDPDFAPLAYEVAYDEQERRINLPPVACSLFQGKVITCQAHPEIQLTEDCDPEKTGISKRRNLRSDLGRIRGSIEEQISTLREKAKDPHLQTSDLFDQIKLEGIDRRGRLVPWLANDFGPTLMIPTLASHVDGLLKELKKT